MVNKKKSDFELLVEFCKATKCTACKLTVEGKWCACDFKRSPRFWNIKKIKKVLEQFARKKEK